MADTFSVIMADGRGASSILETLLDWQAAGLVGDFAWVESSLVKRGAVPALFAGTGLLRGTTVQEALHGRIGHMIRVAVVHPLYGGRPAPTAQSERELLDALSGAGFPRPSALRIIIPQGSDDESTEDLYHGGWRNLVVSPEESSGPVSGTVPLSEDITETQLATHAASAIASLLGLWKGIDAAPFDDSHPLEQAVSLTRTHLRWLDASREEAAIRRRVLDVSRQIPQPLIAGQPGTFLPDPWAAAQDMASEVVLAHESSFRSAMDSEVTIGPARIGILESFRLFFIFMTSSLLFNPQLWLKVIHRRLASGAANATQRLFFGSDSQFLVVPKIESAAMTIGEMTDMGRRLEQHLMSQGAISQRRPPTFPDFFKDMISGAFSLIDGGKRGRIDGVRVGADVGVVPSMSVVVPAPPTDFPVDSSVYEGCEGADAIPSYDARGMRSAHAAMNARGTYGEGRGGGAAMAHSLESWAAAQPRTYVQNITESLNFLVEDAAARVKRLVQLLQDSARDDTPSDAAARRSTASKLRWTALIHVLVGTGVYFLWDWQEWEVTTLVALGVTVLSSWQITSFMIFIQGQREQFLEVHRREQLRSNVEVYRTNLIRSVADLRNSTAAYEQALRWSSVLRSFLGDPFGVSQKTSAAPGLPTVAGMPRNVGLGELVAEDKLQAKLGDHLRAGSFHAGWLSQPWSHVLGSAATTIGPGAIALEQRPEKILDEQVGVPHSLLDRWVPLLAASGVQKEAGDATWQQVAERLASPDFPVDWRRDVDVRPRWGATVSQDTFFKGYREQATAVSGFDRRLRSDEGSPDGFDASSTPWIAEVEVGLGRRVVRVEESKGLHPYELTIFRDAQQAVTDAPVWRMPTFEDLE